MTAVVASLGTAGTGPRSGGSAEDLLPLVYDELRGLAHRFMARERAGHTLQPTALVHEAYLRMVDGTKVNWQGRTHFFAVGARVMRRLLVDHARQRTRAKRGGHQVRVTLSDQPNVDRNLDLHELLALDDALQRLAALDEREARVVELRYFAGLTTEEIAHVMQVSKRTVEGDWAHARAWLRRELTGTATHE